MPFDPQRRNFENLVCQQAAERNQAGSRVGTGARGDVRSDLHDCALAQIRWENDELGCWSAKTVCGASEMLNEAKLPVARQRAEACHHDGLLHAHQRGFDPFGGNLHEVDEGLPVLSSWATRVGLKGGAKAIHVVFLRDRPRFPQKQPIHREMHATDFLGNSASNSDSVGGALL